MGYLAAADQGYADAQISIGKMYERGNGVAQDKVQACMWFNLAVANDETVNNMAELERIAKENGVMVQADDDFLTTRLFNPADRAMPLVSPSGLGVQYPAVTRRSPSRHAGRMA